MKSLADLEAIRAKTLENINMRKDNDAVRVIIGMATCGIAAGARPVLQALTEEVAKRQLAGPDFGNDALGAPTVGHPLVDVF